MKRKNTSPDWMDKVAHELLEGIPRDFCERGFTAFMQQWRINNPHAKTLPQALSIADFISRSWENLKEWEAQHPDWEQIATDLYLCLKRFDYDDACNVADHRKEELHKSEDACPVHRMIAEAIVAFESAKAKRP